MGTSTSTTEPKATTVSASYDVPTEGTIFVLTPDTKKSLSAKLAKDNDASTLSDYDHAVVVEDYSAGKATVKVTAKATKK